MNDNGNIFFCRKRHLRAEEAHLRFSVGKIVMVIEPDLSECNRLGRIQFFRKRSHCRLQISRFSAFMRMNPCGGVNIFILSRKRNASIGVGKVGSHGQNMRNIRRKKAV